MMWFGASLTEDQREVAELARSAAEALPQLEEETSATELVDAADAAREVLVESGIWSISIHEDLGGGGAPVALLQTALIELGATAPALAWAAVQAHAAAAALVAEPRCADLLEQIVAGSQPVCVVERAAPHVRVQIENGEAAGVIGRIDPAGASPAIVLLDDEGVWLLTPGAVRPREAARRTGFAGASTSTADVAGSGDDVVRLAGADAAAARRLLHLGGAAIAAGIIATAAESSIAYSGERVQFGAPLTGLPTVRASLAAQAAAAADAIRRALAGDEEPAESLAHSLAENCESAIEVAAAAVQSRGGYGYLRESGIERLARDAVSLRAATDAHEARRRLSRRFAPA